MQKENVSLGFFYDLALKTIQNLEVEEGILASSKEEIFGCIFGRDSLITALKLLRSHSLDPNPYYLSLAKKIIHGLVSLQGTEINIESGEEPGKCIHEFRITGHERLTLQGIPPWYRYPDGTMRNFDSVDSTPLFLITIYRYMQSSGDRDFIYFIEENIRRALDWIFIYGDKNGDAFIDYEFHKERRSGGLRVQSWMDSSEAAFHEDELDIIFPLSPVEAQAYTYLALKLWAKYFMEKDSERALKFLERAGMIKKSFYQNFILGVSPEIMIAHGLDNSKKPLTSIRSSTGHILWACLNPVDDGEIDCLLEVEHIELLVRRLMAPDVFEPNAGIRTLSKNSKAFDAMSYHNGSIWPHDCSLIAEGMENLGYKKEANDIRRAVFLAYRHFKSPLELFVYKDGQYLEYRSEGGQIACAEQAWSAASMLADSLALMQEVKNQ